MNDRQLEAIAGTYPEAERAGILESLTRVRDRERARCAACADEIRGRLAAKPGTVKESPTDDLAALCGAVAVRVKALIEEGYAP